MSRCATIALRLAFSKCAPAPSEPSNLETRAQLKPVAVRAAMVSSTSMARAPGPLTADDEDDVELDMAADPFAEALATIRTAEVASITLSLIFSWLSFEFVSTTDAAEVNVRLRTSGSVDDVMF